MASASDPSKLNPNLTHWIKDNIAKDFVEAQRLTKEESSSDPDEEPYRSLYAARDLLSSLQEKLEQCPDEVKNSEDFAIVRAYLQLHLGKNFLNAEERSLGEELLEECVQGVERLGNKVKTASLSIQAYNQLGVLWGNRGEQQKALEYLLKAKAVYESHIALPPPLTDSQLLSGREESEQKREKEFEGHHTHTLFYLAQVFGNLDQPKQSAHYCQETLCRQLETQEYDSLEWSISCATLSQYYLNTEHYSQARHCLAAADCVLQKFIDKSSEQDDEGVKDRMAQTKGDLARCWTKYCIAILNSSQDKMESGSMAESKPVQKLFKFESLEVENLEAQVSADLAENNEDAKGVFLFAQKKVEESKIFYSLDNLATGYVEVTQDYSLLYKLLAHFEMDPAIKCRLHKRRIDLLSSTLSELNPQHYLVICRQLTFELAETYREMASQKIVQRSESPSPQAVNKINRLLHSSIDHFQRFVEMFNDHQTGKLPDELEPEMLHPILSAQLSTGRLFTQIITQSKTEEVKFAHHTWST